MSSISHVFGAVLVSILASTNVSAGEPPVPFDHLAERIQRGDNISVSEVAGASINGTVVTVTPQVLTLSVDGTRREYAEAAVARIDRHHRFAKRGALVGMVGGMIFGVAGQAACGIACAPNPAGEIAVLGFFGGIGAGTGAAIGAAFSGSDLVYTSSPARPSAIAVYPIVTRRGMAVGAAVAF
jgi:hypothetical protein